MVRIQNILCPVDFFETSELAFRYATSLAQNYEARLHLLHVVSPIVPSVYEYPIDTTELVRSAAEDAGDRLETLAATAQLANVTVKTDVRTGDVAAEIEAAAAKSKADLLVLGTHGRRGFQRLFLGSVTERLLRTLHIPMLTIGMAKKVKAPPVIKNVLITTDLDEASKEAVEFGFSIAQECQAAVTLMHVINDLIAADVATKYRKPLARGIEDELSDLIPKGAEDWCTIRKRVDTGTPYRMILKAAESEKTDILVMNIHGKPVLDRAMLGSTAERVIRAAPCPVLSIPLREAKGKKK